MNIHSEIRKQVLANLQGQIKGINYFINGRPVFADIEKNCQRLRFLLMK
ncbi:hypothetical protein INT80_00215 [Gallibacterium anatis]|uniref:Uncharacterized protein n=1 Tax=Gallibacterium anatis TaxID=750 RepID=A0A930UVC7_9PAST|nr:hypothetical protein [Gallibacterium anatis]